MIYTVQQRMRNGEMRWTILKDDRYYGSIATYEQARKCVELLNANDLTPEKVARVQEVTFRERVRHSHLSTVLKVLKAKEMR